MNNFVYAGPDALVGRFGVITTGTIVQLTDAEAVSVAGDSNWFAEPTRTQKELKLTGNATLDSADSGKKIQCNGAGAFTVTLPSDPEAGCEFELFHGDSSSGDDVTIDPGDNLIEGAYSAASAVVSAAGSGYDVADTVTIAGGTKDSAAVLAVATIKAVAVDIADGGTGYSANDVLTVGGGTSTTAATITVLTVDGSGVILTAEITEAGNYTVKPSNPASVTGGAGSGATFNLSWGVRTVSVDTAGSYTETPANPAAQGATSGAGTGATLTVTWGSAQSVLTAEMDSIGLYWNGDTWKVF